MKKKDKTNKLFINSRFISKEIVEPLKATLVIKERKENPEDFKHIYFKKQYEEDRRKLFFD